MFGAGTAAALVPSSQIWPFRKFFIPAPLPTFPLTYAVAEHNFFQKGDILAIYSTSYKLWGNNPRAQVKIVSIDAMERTIEVECLPTYKNPNPWSLFRESQILS